MHDKIPMNHICYEDFAKKDYTVESSTYVRIARPRKTKTTQTTFPIYSIRQFHEIRTVVILNMALTPKRASPWKRKIDYIYRKYCGVVTDYSLFTLKLPRECGHCPNDRFQ